MPAVPAQKIGPQQDQPDRAIAAMAIGLAIARQDPQALRNALLGARVIDPGFGIFERFIRARLAPARGALPGGVTVDQ